MTEGLRVVRDGLRNGDVIVVNGLQRVRPGAVVNPKKISMAGQISSRAGHPRNPPFWVTKENRASRRRGNSQGCHEYL